VLILERRNLVGGMAAAEEFHPGYRSPGLLQDVTGVRRRVVDELGLTTHGLALRSVRPSVLALGSDRTGLLLHGDAEAAAREIAPLSSKDAEAYRDYRRSLERIRGVLHPLLDEQPIDLLDMDSIPSWAMMRRALSLRRLGRKEMMEFLRLPPMCAADWLGENFETEILKSALAMPAIAGTWMGPRSPWSNTNLLLWESAAGPGLSGGGPALVAALEKAARASGAEIRTKARVIRIDPDGDGVGGVMLEGGEKIQAPLVAASCDPKQLFLDLVPPAILSTRLQHRIQGYRMRGTTAQVLLALKAPLRFACRKNEEIEYARTGGRLVEMERAFDAVKYRKFSEKPVLEIHAPPSSGGNAPAGQGVASILVHFAAYDLDPAWDDGQRARLGDNVVSILEEHAPGLSSSIVARKVIAPPDIEARYGVTGGHIHHGEHCLDQILIRPTPECHAYRTPIRGLFLCGSGSYPGGGLTCAPGALAASAILKG
jgi:phytoene dehydrogenase-like protein